MSHKQDVLNFLNRIGVDRTQETAAKLLALCVDLDKKGRASETLLIQKQKLQRELIVKRRQRPNVY